MSTEPHPDNVAVDQFAAAMKAKLQRKRADGREGWQDLSPDRIAYMLVEHVEKGDPLDVANFAMMLWHVTGGKNRKRKSAAVPLKAGLRIVAADVLRDAPCVP